MTVAEPVVRPTYNLKRDGEPVEGMQGVDEFEVLRYIHRHHSYSVDHALAHEGYSLEVVEPGTPYWFLTEEARAERLAAEAKS